MDENPNPDLAHLGDVLKALVEMADAAIKQCPQMSEVTVEHAGIKVKLSKTPEL